MVELQALQQKLSNINSFNIVKIRYSTGLIKLTQKSCDQNIKRFEKR